MKDSVFDSIKAQLKVLEEMIRDAIISAEVAIIALGRKKRNDEAFGCIESIDKRKECYLW